MNIEIKINPIIKWVVIIAFGIGLLLYSPIQLYKPGPYPSIEKIVKTDTVYIDKIIKGEAIINTLYVDTNNNVFMDIIIDTVLLGLNDSLHIELSSPSMEYILTYKAPIINNTIVRDVIKRDLKEYAIVSISSCLIGITIPYIIINKDVVFSFIKSLF